MPLDPNFRVAAFQEARKCFRLIETLDVEQPEFWANLLGAIANGVMACAPDSVISAVIAHDMHSDKRKAAVRDHLAQALDDNLKNGA